MIDIPKRILYVITDLQIGGVPLHLFRLATEARRRGFVVQAVSLAPPGPVSAMLQDAGIETTSCLDKNIFDIGALFRLRKCIAGFKPDLIHSFLFHANFLCRLAAPMAGVHPRQLICEIQTVEIERPWHLWLDRWTHRLCRIEIGNSPSVIHHLRIAAKIPPHKLHLIPGGIDTQRFSDAVPIPRSQLGIPDDVPLLIWTGRLDPVKGLDDLLQAVADPQLSPHIHLLLVGDGAIKNHLERQITTLKLERRVHLPGVRKDIPELLKAVDVFVFPSFTEGLPNAVLEAMAAALPIVATDVPGNHDLLQNEQTALLVPPHDPAALAHAIHRIISDPSIGKKLSLPAQQYAQQHYDINIMYDKYFDLYINCALQIAQTS